MRTVTKFIKDLRTFGNSSLPMEIIPVRVKDIILDENHPEYEKYGKVDSLGAIKYALLDSKTNTEDTTSLPPAFPLNNHSKVLPLRNEVVYLIRGVKADNYYEQADYYLPPISLFNDINYIPSEDNNDKSTKGGGLEFKGNPRLRPLYPFNGDVIMQGRYGQSIRMSGAQSFGNTLTNRKNKEKPLTIISNGHKESQLNSLYVEDINKDLTSIYLTTDHLIPLEQSRDKYASAEKRPVLTKNYDEGSAILTSQRIHLNTTKDDILLTSSGNTSITAKQVSLDGVSSIGLDAKKIYLGEKAMRFELQPVLLGNQTELFLYELLSALNTLSTNLINARTANQIAIPALNANGFTLGATVRNLLEQINPNGPSRLKSKKVFTE